MGFWLASEEVETEDGLRFSGPGLSVLRVTESVDSIATLYVYSGEDWLPFSPVSEDIEAALDAIIAIQESLIGGATE